MNDTALGAFLTFIGIFALIGFICKAANGDKNVHERLLPYVEIYRRFLTYSYPSMSPILMNERICYQSTVDGQEVVEIYDKNNRSKKLAKVFGPGMLICDRNSFIELYKKTETNNPTVIMNNNVFTLLKNESNNTYTYVIDGDYCGCSAIHIKLY